MGRICLGLKSVLVKAVLFYALASPIITISNVDVPIRVRRRIGGDIYYFTSSNNSFTICHDDNITFLVSERRCVKNQELFDGCSFGISPIMERSTFRVALTFRHYPNSTGVEWHTAVTTTSNNSITTAIIVHLDNINQPVNGSLCQISSLEVYRGRSHITRISHDGFFLSNEGILGINQINLAYNVDDYNGELYRMNITCTAEGLPRSGCLFFKVIGLTQVTNAKFNNSVQGTIDNNITTSEPTTMAMTTLTMTSQVTDLSTTSPVKDITTADSRSEIHMPPFANRTDLITTAVGPIITTAMTKTSDHGLLVGSFQYYMVVAAGSGVAFVALTAFVILVIYVIRRKKSKISLDSEVIQRELRQRQRSRNSNIEETPSAVADVSILPDIDLTPVESSLLEPPILLPPSDADYEVVHEADRDRSLPPRKCDQIPVYIFLGPRESDPPIPKSPIECKQNLAYLHLGPEDNSTAASLQHKPITCKKNAAYIHLDPEDNNSNQCDH